MKNKLVFRILGAISSALIIASVFIPYVSVKGFSQSLWEAHSAVGTTYLPIMIIVFGAIGVLCFSANIKTELSYASTGAILFFLITQTIPIIDQGTFNTMGVGYYCLCIGDVLTGLMAFLCNIKTKTKNVELPVTEEKKEEVSMINQIDKLYNNEYSLNSATENNQLENIIQPLQPLSNASVDISSIPESNSTIPITPLPINDWVSENIEPLTTLNNDLVTQTNQQLEQTPVSINPVMSEIGTQQANMDVTNISIPEVGQSVNQPVEQAPAAINPVTSEFDMSQQNIVESNVEPLESVQTLNASISNGQPQENVIMENPVLAEFSNPIHPTSILSQPIAEEPIVSQENMSQQNLQPLGEGLKIETANNSNDGLNSSSNLDIFG